MTIGKKIGIGIAVIAGILIILWFFQSQGIIKVFPTAEDREVRRLTRIDESKFVSAEGLPEEAFQAKIEEVYASRDVVLERPTDAAAWMDFAIDLEFLNDHESAIAAWKQVLKYQELNFLAAYNIGNVSQYFIKDYEAAEEYYLKALAVRPDHALSYQGLMDIYRYNVKAKQDRYEPLLLDAIEKDPLNTPSYYVALVDFFAANGNFEKAREYLDDVEATNPQAAAGLRTDYPGL